MRLILAVFFASAALTGCEPVFDCNDAVKNEAVSPGGRYIAAVFERDCGATTDYSTSVTLRDAKEPFDPTKQHPVVTVEGRPAVALQWSSDESLTVMLPSIETFTKQEAWRDVRIVYE